MLQLSECLVKNVPIESNFYNTWIKVGKTCPFPLWFNLQDIQVVTKKVTLNFYDYDYDYDCISASIVTMTVWLSVLWLRLYDCQYCHHDCMTEGIVIKTVWLPILPQWLNAQEETQTRHQLPRQNRNYSQIVPSAKTAGGMSGKCYKGLPWIGEPV